MSICWNFRWNNSITTHAYQHATDAGAYTTLFIYLFLHSFIHPLIHPFINPSIRPFIRSSFSNWGLVDHHAWHDRPQTLLAFRSGLVALKPCWRTLRPGWLAIKPAWLAIRSGWLSIRLYWVVPKSDWLAKGRGGDDQIDKWMGRQKTFFHNGAGAKTKIQQEGGSIV